MIKRFTISGLTVIGPVNDLRLAATIESSLAKTAGFKGEIIRDAEGNVDLKAEMAKRPTALWVKAKAIEADKENDNGDYFPLDELRASYKTFEGVPIFTNHENNDIAKAKGKVVLAEWDEAEKSVYCTFFIDREAHAPICRAIEEGIITDVSMGTQVDFSTCSICNNRATDASSYCDHVKAMKGRMMGGKKVYEKNYGLKFIELSLVTDGACQSCTIQEVIEPEEALARAASAIGLVKTGIPKKLAGQEEIKSLNDAMALLEVVSRKMLDQRKYLDMEFLSKLVDVLADLQEVTDELVDQGYGSLGGGAGGGMSQEPVIPPLPEANDQKGQGMEPANPVSAGPADLGVGTVTEPTVAASPDARTVAYKVQDLRQKVQKIYQQAQELQGGQKVSKPNETISKVAMIWDNPSIRNFKAEMNDGDYKVIVGSDEIYGMKGGTKIASVKIADLEPEQRQLLRSDTQQAMDEMLKAFKAKYAGIVVAEKAPSNSAEQQTMTMEVQLESQMVPLHPRTKDVRESVTEVQLESKATGYDQHARQEDPKHSITQKQLDDDPGYQARQGKERDQTQEGQLRDTGIKANSNPADGKGSAAGVKDQSEQVTEGQLGEWKSAEKLHHPTQITEKQLAEQAQPWGRRIASKEDAKMALAAAMQAMVRTAKALGVTPEEVLSVVRNSTNSVQAQVESIKAVVASAGNKEARETLLKRASFHGHSFNASKDDIKSYLFGSLVDVGFEPELGLAVSAEIAKEKNAASSISDAIMAAAKQPEPEDEDDLSKEWKELLGSSLKEMIRKEASGEDDITVVLDKKQVSADPNDHEKFAKEAFEKARKYASLKGYEVTKDVEVSQSEKGISVTVRGKKAEAKKEEPKADATASRKEIRRKLVEAQFGGAAGGMPPAPGMDAAQAPVGTTVPGGGAGGMGAEPPPGAAPVQSFGQDEPVGPEEELEPEAGEALPPGSICPACGSDDVDVKSGEFNCNGCGAEGTISVKIDVKTWPDSIEEKSPDKGDEGGAGEEMGAEAAPGGAGGIPMPEVGLAASFKVTPEMVKLAGNKPVGSFCPHCGSDKVKLSSTKDHHIGKCSKCDGMYRIDAYVDTNNPKELMARIAWKDRNVVKVAKARIEAANIKAKKAKLVSALKQSKLEEKFAKADVAGKAKIIAKLADQGLIGKE